MGEGGRPCSCRIRIGNGLVAPMFAPVLPQTRVRLLFVGNRKSENRLGSKFGTILTNLRFCAKTPLNLESRMAGNGVIFSDGIEKDFLEFNSGTQAVIGIAERKGLPVE